MQTSHWFLLIGSLLLILGISRPFIQSIPATSAIIYLTVGVVLGPVGLALFHFNPLKEAATLEVMTEVAVLISLFSAGVKMPAPFNLKRWQAPLQLAFISMTVTVIAAAFVGHYVLALPVGAAVLLGAIVAPTDPVLATDVQVRHPGDNDRLRFSLTCEAGLNDGTAFPFVMLGLGLLGLHELGSFFSQWIFVDILWATLAGTGIGVVSGYLLALLTSSMKASHGSNNDLLEDFIGLGLIGVVYGVSHIVHAWGFLAVFAAGVALRQTELKNYFRQSRAKSLPEPLYLQEGIPVNNEPELIIPKTLNHQSAEPAILSEASLVFKEHLERLSEVILVILVGGMLFLDSWSISAVIFALFLFFIIRPLSVFAGLAGTGVGTQEQWLMSWFGVRGIGSLYYLMYAIVHGLPEKIALELTHITLVVITLSIFLHGISVKPLLWKFHN